MRSVSRNLGEETLCDVFTAEYSVASDDIKGPLFSLVVSVVTERVLAGVLDKRPNQSFNPWSRLDTITQELIKKIVYEPGFIVPVAAFT